MVSNTTDGNRTTMIATMNSTTMRVYGQFGTTGTNYSYKDFSISGSDIRLKTNIKKSTADSLSIINKINMFEFDWKDKTLGHWDVGFIANEIVDVDPRLAYIPEDEEGHASINTFYMQGHIVKAIQQLTARIEELEKKLKGAA